MAKLPDNRAHFSVDAKYLTRKGRKTITVLNSDVFDKFVVKVKNEYQYEVGYIPEGFEHRPDLISNVFYGTPKYWWLLLLANDITDPFEGLNQGDQILIPKLNK